MTTGKLRSLRIPGRLHAKLPFTVDSSIYAHVGRSRFSSLLYSRSFLRASSRATCLEVNIEGTPVKQRRKLHDSSLSLQGPRARLFKFGFLWVKLRIQIVNFQQKAKLPCLIRLSRQSRTKVTLIQVLGEFLSRADGSAFACAFRGRRRREGFTFIIFEVQETALFRAGHELSFPSTALGVPDLIARRSYSRATNGCPWSV